MGLEEKIRAARRRWVPAGAFEFEIERPTDYDLALVRAKKLPDGVLVALELIKGHVTGWRKISEADFLAGGGSDVPAFTREAFAAFIEDRPDLWGPLSDAIWAGIAERERELERLRGN